MTESSTHPPDSFGAVSVDALVAVLRERLLWACSVKEELAHLRIENIELHSQLACDPNMKLLAAPDGLTDRSGQNFAAVVPTAPLKALPAPQQDPSNKVATPAPPEALPTIAQRLEHLEQTLARDRSKLGNDAPSPDPPARFQQKVASPAPPEESPAILQLPGAFAADVELISNGFFGADDRPTKQPGTDKASDHPQLISGKSKSRKSMGVKNRQCFADAESMKDEVRLAICRPKYNVADLYQIDSRWAKIAVSERFGGTTLLVICANALWIAVDTDHNSAALLKDANLIFIIAENLFCFYFTFEVVVRFMAFRYKADALKDSWFFFDTILLGLMILETWIFYAIFVALDVRSDGAFGDASILKLTRLIRLVRMARVAKLLASMPELTILIKGICIAARTVFFTLVLMMAIVFIFAVAFRQLTDGEEIGEAYFPDVPKAMSNLFLYGALPDQVDITTDIGVANLALGFLFIMFVFLASLTLMNMLIGILCDVVSVVSAVEKEQILVNSVKSKLLKMLAVSGIDEDDDMQISKGEFAQLLTNPEAARVIQEVGVDAVALVDYSDVIFAHENEGVDFEHFIQLMLQFRGSNGATVRDIIDLHKVVKRENERSLQEMRSLQEQTMRSLHNFQ